MVFDSRRGVSVVFGDALEPSGVTWEWDGSEWAVASSTGPAPRTYGSMAYDVRRGVTVLFGGFSMPIWTSVALGDTWEWDGNAWSLRAQTGPAPRGSHAMAFDSARGVTVLFGGAFRDGRVSGEVWEWDGSVWTLRHVPCVADCDRGTGPGVLDVFDFLCFQNRYAAGAPYACDCDTSSGPQVCDVFDFLCFQNAFAAGCQ